MEENNVSPGPEVKERAPKEKSARREEKSRRSFMSVLNDYRGEYKKIIWPTREELIKQTITVVITCLIFTAVITVLDLAFLNGFNLFTQFGEFLAAR